MITSKYRVSSRSSASVLVDMVSTVKSGSFSKDGLEGIKNGRVIVD